MAQAFEAVSLDDRFSDAFPPLFSIAYRVAYRLTGVPAEAEDLAAEALVRAYTHWDRLGEAPYVEAWVVRVTTNLTLHHLARKRPRLEQVPLRDVEDAVAVRLALVEALRALPARQREAIVLRHLAGLPEPLVAAALGVSLGTVKTHLRRGLVKLRGGLGEQGAG
ncbi:MAG TPA: sigma-70 family RNA polymerase sigma factor [Acidimicrobiales bacterium]|nr:sigma-70 family RNA polymerase sigma factor [Acidimicrobiales bacterium]